jgi:septal ring factor EnvC (AmiA/AmiB activator)
MSLYGHNDAIFRKVGERVTAGDAIAAVGDTGGRPRPELYFEIRRNAQPLDPRPWFRSPAPGGP